MRTKLNTLAGSKNNFDILLFASTFLLVVIGLITIYDASVVIAFRDFGDKFYFLKNQLIWATFGFFTLIFFTFFNYQKLIKLAFPLLIISLIGLFLVIIPFIGTDVFGARRWITIGNFNFQPSEFAKLAVIVYAASIITKISSFRFNLYDILIVYFLPVSLITLLVIIQPDLGTALIFLAIAVVIYFIGKAPIWHFILMVPPIIAAIILAVVTQPYRIERFKSFLDPSYDPAGASYQINQIINALASGGIFGVGLGGSNSKFEFIPGVHNDAIFAIVVEELGFIGGIILILLLLFLITRAIKIAEDCPDFTGKLLAMGIVALIATQCLFNIASMVALVPLTGIPLPFISYGGSSLLVMLASIGILQNIKRQT